jgi:peroxiredoxin
MEERTGEAFAGTEQLTVMGKQLQAGDPAPDFRLDYLDLADLAVRTISLADSTGLVRLLSVVNSLERHIATRGLHLYREQGLAADASELPEQCRCAAPGAFCPAQ